MTLTTSTDATADGGPPPWGLGRRAALAGLLGALLLAGMVDLGLRRVRDPANLTHCLADEPACIGRELVIGNKVVVGTSKADRSVAVKVPGSVLRLSPWPGPLPFPRRGTVLSVRGRYEGDLRLAPAEVLVQPLRVVKVAVSLVVSLGWGGFALTLAVRRRRPRSTPATAQPAPPSQPGDDAGG